MRRLLWGPTASLLLAAAPAAAQDADLHFTEDASGGNCHARVWGGVAPDSLQRMVLAFHYDPGDSTLVAEIIVYGWSRARDGDPGRHIPMTLAFDTGAGLTSSDGGYEVAEDNGEDGAVGIWNPGAPSAGVMAALATARSVHVRFDGMDLAFGLPAGGRMASSLTACAARLP